MLKGVFYKAAPMPRCWRFLSDDEDYDRIIDNLLIWKVGDFGQARKIPEGENNVIFGDLVYDRFEFHA